MFVSEREREREEGEGREGERERELQFVPLLSFLVCNEGMSLLCLINKLVRCYVPLMCVEQCLMLNNA